MQIFYLKIIPLYEQIKQNIENLFFLDRKVKKVILKDQVLIDSSKNYVDSLNVCKESVKLLNEELSNLQIFSIYFDFEIANSELVKKHILNKYLEIFEIVLPLIFTSSDPSLYIASINLYNKWKLSKLEVENRKEAQEIENLKIDSFKNKERAYII